MRKCVNCWDDDRSLDKYLFYQFNQRRHVWDIVPQTENDLFEPLKIAKFLHFFALQYIPKMSILYTVKSVSISTNIFNYILFDLIYTTTIIFRVNRGLSKT